MSQNICFADGPAVSLARDYQITKALMHLSRRQFVTSSALAATFLGMQPSLFAAGRNAKMHIGVQLYSVRDDAGKNFDAALEQIAKMGFEGVEFAGYFTYAGKAKELRQKLDSCGLKGISTHIGTGSLRGDDLKKTIEFHQTIGCKYLIVPGDGDFTSHDKSAALAETFNKAAEVLKPLGMACGYHNHTHEFEKDGDKTYYDLFAERTTADVVLEQDCGWSSYAGVNPVSLMKRYPGRFKEVHFKPTVVKADEKDSAKKAIFGQDSVDWVSVLAACSKLGGTEWVLVEQEVFPDGKSPMECTALSLAGLKKIW